jgi:hypothetical protein
MSDNPDRRHYHVFPPGTDVSAATKVSILISDQLRILDVM